MVNKMHARRNEHLLEFFYNCSRCTPVLFCAVRPLGLQLYVAHVRND